MREKRSSQNLESAQHGATLLEKANTMREENREYRKVYLDLFLKTRNVAILIMGIDGTG